MFNIEITYKTGNSFGSHQETECIGACWTNIERVKESLDEIKNHNKYFNDIDYEKWKKTFKKNSKYEENSEFIIVLKDDDGNDIKINTFWRGYFERLIRARIVINDPDDGYCIDF